MFSDTGRAFSIAWICGKSQFRTRFVPWYKSILGFENDWHLIWTHKAEFRRVFLRCILADAKLTRNFRFPRPKTRKQSICQHSCTDVHHSLYFAQNCHACSANWYAKPTPNPFKVHQCIPTRYLTKQLHRRYKVLARSPTL